MQPPFSEICYVVRDLEATIARWIAVMKAGPFYTISSDVMIDRTYRGRPATDRFVAGMGFMGTTVMEFIQPLDDQPSIFREVLDVKGEALHHILPRIRGYTPQEYDAEFAGYVSAGLEPAMTLTVPGFGRNAFFDGVEAFGAFIELLETPPEDHRLVDEMYAAHLTWDGRDPIRSLL